MSVVVVFALFVAAVAALGLVPGVVAHSRGTLFAFDFALVLMPALVLYVSGCLLNPPLAVGFGLFVYPVLALLGGVAVFYFRVFLLDRMYPHARVNSLTCVMITCATAAVVGAIVPPFYE